MNNPICTCGELSVFVNNVPSKTYYYCRTCKEEVIEAPTKFDYPAVAADKLEFWNWGSQPTISTSPTVKAQNACAHNNQHFTAGPTSQWTTTCADCGLSWVN